MRGTWYRKNTKKAGRCGISDCVAAFAMVFCILLTLFKVMGFAPFGMRSLAWTDADIQYLDFFSYLKDVLRGENSIFYSSAESACAAL